MVKILTMTIGKIQISRGQNYQPEIWLGNWTQNVNFAIDHGANSRVSVAMVKFFWPLTIGQIPGCHGHGQCLPPPPHLQVHNAMDMS